MTSLTDLLQKARYWGITIATAESCTGGMLAAALTDLPGASDMFDCGFVTYSNAAKIAMLGVSQASLDAYGAVSEEVALEMVRGALEHSTAQLAVSITGVAGPGGSELKPEGLVCFGIMRKGQDASTETINYGAIGRDVIRRAARDRALKLLSQALG